ncbi:aspartyl-phosphate phosphatase Spo0E family protein [Ruminiclostridium josui]|uniref:aspartyl-phosphate phosphatase Spo0E family protein n=1 Tax=Ruminiclostridium josui TaxID=1499 RepID=UPI000466BC2E|nr:aspartyl-phosphate phosphatase Spo0E family protein [Ruminiclostridium josui]
MDIRQLYNEMETLREKLNLEMEDCLENGGMSLEVLDLSKKLDELIVAYMRLEKSEPKTESNEVA